MQPHCQTSLYDNEENENDNPHDCQVTTIWIDIGIPSGHVHVCIQKYGPQVQAWTKGTGDHLDIIYGNDATPHCEGNNQTPLNDDNLLDTGV
jgi:hypothetical protein